jgi:hypothetical protein
MSGRQSTTTTYAYLDAELTAQKATGALLGATSLCSRKLLVNVLRDNYFKQAFRPTMRVNECNRDFSPTIRHNPTDSFQTSLLFKLEKLDWGSILDNKSDGHAG